jgi:hypothetical protein
LGDALQAAASPKATNIGFSIRKIGPVFPQPKDGPEGFFSSVGVLDISLADGLPDQMRNRTLGLFGEHFKDSPEIVFQVELRSLHDV